MANKKFGHLISSSSRVDERLQLVIYSYRNDAYLLSTVSTLSMIHRPF